jgi:hypothetical protein
MKLSKILFILTLIFLSACGPAAKLRKAERKLAKLVKENPDLVKTDTIWKDTTFQPDTIHELFQGEIGPDLWPVDSLTGYFEGKASPDVLDSLNRGFKGILEHSGDMDTTFRSKKSTVRVIKNGKNLTVDVETVPDPIKAEVPVEVNTVTPVTPLTWYETFFLHIGQTVGALGFGLLFLILAYIIYRFVKFISAEPKK